MISKTLSIHICNQIKGSFILYGVFRSSIIEYISDVRVCMGACICDVRVCMGACISDIRVCRGACIHDVRVCMGACISDVRVCMGACIHQGEEEEDDKIDY